MRMKVLPLVTDNVSELLVKILDFTIARHRLLSANLENVHTPGYTPKDLPVTEFATLLEAAVYEHTTSKRLLLCDGDNVKFGLAGSVRFEPVLDDDACDLIKQNPNEYIEYVLKKLSENSLNQKVAAELFKQKQGMSSILSGYEITD